MPSNLTTTLGISLSVLDVSPNVVTQSLNLQGIQLGCTVSAYEQYFQVPVAGATFNFPAGMTTAFIVYVRNRGANNITVTFTPAGGAATAVVLTPLTNGFGGFFLLFETAESAGGISALSLAAAVATTPAEVFVGS
jgi:hypothetical protein